MFLRDCVILLTALGKASANKKPAPFRGRSIRIVERLIVEFLAGYSIGPKSGIHFSERSDAITNT
ncbi:hypothetical protein FQV39_25715 [Bosea sp. F3-2]|uniref:hypothetical protein n=1 Tax=Bosea sp. F3-2 TaxID=2599640 RepID=UPI0011EBA996|nr:hypothetical protein [Bosea sp. F3-2]QEL25617.1 hypothetical protein FQV39_25715 [Bosea sp. F3-2]